MRTCTRAFAPGGTFLFTVNLADRSATLHTDHIDDLRDSVRRVRDRHPFHIDAMVVGHEPDSCTCSACQSALVKIGEDG